MTQRIFNLFKILIVLNAFFFCVSNSNAENVMKATAPVQKELQIEHGGDDIAEITEIDGFVVNPNLPIDVLYRKVKRARKLRIAGIVCTVCGGYITIPVVGLPLLIVGCRQYRAYNRAGLDYGTVKYRYQQSLRNGTAPADYTNPTPVYVPSSESGKE